MALGPEGGKNRSPIGYLLVEHSYYWSAAIVPTRIALRGSAMAVSITFARR